MPSCSVSPPGKIRRFARWFAAGAAVAVALCFVAARVAPPASVPVLRYPGVGDGPGEVPPERFFMQMRDFAADGWATVSPFRVWARACFLLPLPRRPFLVTFDRDDVRFGPDVAPVLAEYGFQSRHAPRGGNALFAPATPADAAGSAIARVGGLRGAWPFPLPRLDVDCGRMAFSVRVLRDSVDPAFFGTLRFARPEGVRTPCALLVYEPEGVAPSVQADVPALADGEAFELALPAGIRFPLDVVVYDATRTVWQFETTLPRSAVETGRRYREPVVAPDVAILPEGEPARIEEEKAP